MFTQPEESNVIEFEHIQDWSLPTLTGKDAATMLLQWNLDSCLTIKKFHFVGSLLSNYDKLIHDFFKCPSVLNIIGASSLPSSELFDFDSEELSTKVLSTDFFDRLIDENVVSPMGHIRGCLDETYDGITVGDELRELLINPESLKAHVFGEDDRKEFIFIIFKLLCIGGSMCQPDSISTRYIDVTKNAYKDMLTVYRDANGEVKVASKVYRVRQVRGLTLHPYPESPHNLLVLVVDPVKKHIITLKYDYKPFW